MQDAELDGLSTQINLPAPLRQYQWEGVRFLLGNDSALLADQMGLGKTVQIAVALSLLLPKYKLGRALIIVPASLRINWRHQCNWTNCGGFTTFAHINSSLAYRSATYIVI